MTSENDDYYRPVDAGFKHQISYPALYPPAIRQRVDSTSSSDSESTSAGAAEIAADSTEGVDSTSSSESTSVGAATDSRVQFIPLGTRCPSALICKYANLRKTSLPFDWGGIWTPHKVKLIIENDFDGFCRFEQRADGSTANYLYDFESTHMHSDMKTNISNYERRIERFKHIFARENLRKKHIYFVYTNEDFMYKEKFRSREFNDAMFRQMLDFESFLTERHADIEYNIIYFGFDERQIPPDSRIIYVHLESAVITLDSDTYLRDPYDSDVFRLYCGSVLAEMFGTAFESGDHTEDQFYT
jgi:hypothetical protein